MRFAVFYDRRLTPPSSLPRIENALPGRDGYEVEIFGMEGIPAPDVADYKRRKEIELGLSAGSISQPQAKRPKTENRPLSEEELRAQLEAHKALMGAHEAPAPAPTDTNQSASTSGFSSSCASGSLRCAPRLPWHPTAPGRFPRSTSLPAPTPWRAWHASWVGPS